MDASLDAIKKIMNRAAIISFLAQVLKTEEKAAIALADVDFFVNIDSKVGKEEGDKILCRMAAFFMSCENAAVGRYGGDEFLMVFKSIEKEELEERLNNFRKSFRKQRFISEASVYAKAPITISIGVAIGCEGGRTVEGLLKTSEIALAMAKKGGRNQVAFAPPNNICIMQSGEAELSTIIGGGLRGYSGDRGLAAGARIMEPYGVDILNKTELVFADRGNHRIRKIDGESIIETIAGTGEYGYSGDGGCAKNARLNKPSGTAVADDGSIYIADTGNHCIRKITPDGVISTLAGCGIEGYEGDGRTVEHSKLSRPGGVAVDRLGNVYTNDYGNNVIRMITPDKHIYTIAGSGEYGYGGDGGEAAKAAMDRPYGLAASSEGCFVYIADYGNHCIREVDIKRNIIRTICGTGEPGYSGDGEDGSRAMLNSPYWVSVWQEKYLLIADAGNHCIRIMNLHSKKIATLVGGGSPGYCDGGSIKNACLNIPAGMVSDTEGKVLFIADYGNNAIRRLRIKRIPC